MSGFIIGTAGHVDHGKSVLIRALTGIDPDRLAEEKQRGMTIDLGFAWIDLPRAGRVGIVDVPGHERFLKNMLAGAGGVDLALLVVAADEGVMPQTREHLDILALLDVRQVVAAVTKIDLADPDLVRLVTGEVRELLAERKLPLAAAVPTSAVTGDGLEELRGALDAALAVLQPRGGTGPARLPIDRVFTMTGFGTVVTGTLVSGTLRVGDALRVLPGRLECRIRGLQVHGEKVEEATPGHRVAVNLVGASKHELARGQVLAQAGACEETTIFDALATLLPTAKAVRHYARVRLHVGTAEVIARLALGSDQTLEPGREGAVQVRCERPIACAKGDRFVLRQYSPGVTIGGGVVVDPAAKRKRRAAIERGAFARALSASPEETVLAAVRASPSGLRAREITERARLPDTEAGPMVERLAADGMLVSLAGRMLTPDVLRALGEALLAAVREYHDKNPAEPEMPKATWAAGSPLAEDPKALDAAAALLAGQGELVVSGAGVRLPQFEARLSEKQDALLQRVERLLLDARLTVPTVGELDRIAGIPPQAVREILRLGRNVRRIVKVSDSLFYPATTIEEVKRMVREEIERSGSVTVASFRDLTGTSRKYTLPLLEYLDSVGFTQRSGDERTLVPEAE
jgi:selenocysteine-specific elongation factor